MVIYSDVGLDFEFDVGFNVVLDFRLQNRLHVVLDPHLKIKNPLKIKGLGVVFADWTVSS